LPRPHASLRAALPGEKATGHVQPEAAADLVRREHAKVCGVPVALVLLVAAASRVRKTPGAPTANVAMASVGGRLGSLEAEADSESLISLLEEKRLGAFFERARQEPSSVLQLLRDAGIYGVIAYLIAFILFYGTAAPIAEVSYYALRGVWFDPRPLLLGGEGRAEALALFASFYLLCKPFAPVRLGGALYLTPDVKRFIEDRPVLANVFDAARKAAAAVGELVSSAAGGVLSRVSPREALKGELLALAAKAKGGIATLDEDDQARFEELLLVELPKLNPVAEPTRSELFSGEWECRWTNEKEINFAVKNGLFGLPWVRTYQTIDIAAGTLENVLEFEDGELRVNSSIAPDSADGQRFQFAFESCSLRRKSFRIPLPPVGRGWGELLYLDDEMRIQRDIRGDMLVATKVR